MRTRDALAIGHALGRIERTLDAWEESKHKRAANGQFTSGGGGGGSAAKESSSSGSKSGASGPTKSEVDAFIAKVTGKKPFYGISPEDEKKIKSVKYKVDNGMSAPEDLQHVAREILSKKLKRSENKMLTAGQKRERASSKLSMNSKEWGNKGKVVFKENEFPYSIKVNGKTFYQEANGELNTYGDDGNKGYGQAYFGNGYKAYVDACGRVRTEKTRED